MAQSVMNYYISSNSARGYVSFFQSNFSELNSVIRLGGYPTIVATDILNGILVRAQEKGFHPELIHNCLDHSLEGVIVPEKKTGIVNFPLYDEGAYPIAAILNDENLSRTRACLAAAQKHFAQALKIHNSWDTLYIATMDFSVANQLASEMINKLIEKQQNAQKGIAVDRFFGAVTEDGTFDYIENLTANIEKRYFINGSLGTGKCTFLRRIAKSAMEAGFDAEIYHSPLDPDRLNMIIVRKLNLCLFDSTPPQEYCPSRPEDKTIDFYKAAVTEKTDEKYHLEIAAIASDYKAEVAKAAKQISKAKRYYDEVQRGYLSKINAESLEVVEEKILNTVFE